MAKILSLFDGMACGMIAMKNAGVEVESYSAYEIDKYAVQAATHNFPMIEEKGDVFKEDFTKYEGIDWLIGGSPCTYWSIAQKNNRETEASGLGWELFSQYVRALHEAKPKFFIYENNKSMAKAIRDSIREAFGFEEICINSALVSAQNRQRYYWVGKRNADGTYSKVPVEQPEDRGILLKDILEGATDREKGRTLLTSAGRTTTREYFIKSQSNMAYEPVGTTKEGKAFAVTAYYSTGQNAPHTLEKHKGSMVAEPVNLTANCGSKGTSATVMLTQPIRVGCMPSPDGTIKGSQANRIYSVEGKAINQVANGGGAGAKTGLYAMAIDEPLVVREATKQGYTEINPGECVDMTQPNSKTRRGRNMADKSNCLTTSPQYYQYVAKYNYATACEWDESGIPTKAISAADGKTYTVYTVADGNITIKGKTYPIKLVDGYYIIRKLTVTECKRLQTVPEWYDLTCVSNSQGYKLLGNGWTCDVITHLIKACLATEKKTFKVKPVRVRK